MKKIIDTFRNILFSCVILVALVGVLLYTFVWKEQDTVSLFENRNLAMKSDLKDTKFWDSSTQNTLEDVLADQFVGRQGIVQAKKKVDQLINRVIYGANTDEYVLTKLGDTNVYQLGDSDYMINGLMEFSQDIENRILNRIYQMNKIAEDYPEIDFYLYRPVQGHETSIFDSANNVTSYGDYYNGLFKDNVEFPLAFLEIESLDTYKEMFYSSDHHWNYRGAYQGYVDIMTLMGKEDEILEPESINSCNGYTFYGTFSTRTANMLGPDDYYMYEIDYDDVSLVLKGKAVDESEDIYHPKYYLSHLDEYSDPFTYHYNFSYSGYPEEPYYQFLNEKEEGNILIIGDSYATAIARLLASSYKNSYFVNPGTYISTTGRYFTYDDFINEHDIDTVLFMYTIENYFAVDKEWGDIYKNYDVHRTVEE